MSRNTRFYSQRDHSVIIREVIGIGAGNGFIHTVTDFYEGDDAIGSERIGERVALTQGFDRSVVSFASTDGGQITLKLKPTSASAGFLNGLFNRQKTTPTLLEITETNGVKEVTVLREAGIDKGSEASGGPTMQPLEFTFIGASIEYDEATTL